MRFPAMKRPVVLGAAWTASAAAAVGLGFLAVSLVDASASPGTTSAAATSSSTPEATPTGSVPRAPVTPSAVSGEFPTVGGTVYADCAGGSPFLAGVPGAGWWLDDSDDPGEIEFENGVQKVEVHVTCGADGPQFFLEGPRADDGGRDDGRSSSPSATPSAGHTSGYDDSDGRDGGGHGSDDGPGDDSSGRDGGGDGSDDSDGDDDSGHGGSGSDD